MGNSPKVLEALNRLNEKLKDPVYLEEFLRDFDLALIADENRLICAVIDPMYREATVGDMIAYGMNHNYYDELEQKALDLFYQFHGQGD